MLVSVRHANKQHVNVLCFSSQSLCTAILASLLSDRMVWFCQKWLLVVVLVYRLLLIC